MNLFGYSGREKDAVMRKLIRTVIIVLGVIVVLVVAVGFYAVLNLNGIIQKQRGLILSKASAAVGRKVEVQDIHASLGWGVIADLRGVTVADDPAFSQHPFVQAADVYVRIALLPLLSRRVEIKQISLKQPVVHIIKNKRGELNLSSIGRNPAAGEAATPTPAAPPTAEQPLRGAPLTGAQPAGQTPTAGAGALGGVSVSSLTVENATLVYQDPSGSALAVRSIDLDVENLAVSTPIDIKLSLAAFGKDRNLTLTGKVGPLMTNGAIDLTPFRSRLTWAPGRSLSTSSKRCRKSPRHCRPSSSSRTRSRPRSRSTALLRPSRSTSRPI